MIGAHFPATVSKRQKCAVEIFKSSCENLFYSNYFITSTGAPPPPPPLHTHTHTHTHTHKLRYGVNSVYEHCGFSMYTLRKKVQLGTLFVPYLEPSGKRVPKRVLYMFKNLKRFRKKYITKKGSKEPKRVLKKVLKTHLEPFREPLKVPPPGGGVLT